MGRRERKRKRKSVFTFSNISNKAKGVEGKKRVVGEKNLVRCLVL